MGLRVQKISNNNYMFGTKKIYSKINNGILLVRVGGGFMDIDNFYKQYGDQELRKQELEDQKRINNGEEIYNKHGEYIPPEERMSIGSAINAKNAAAKIRASNVTATKKKTSAVNKKKPEGDTHDSSRHMDDDSKEPFEQFDGTNPGEYEINLGDDETDEGSRFSSSPNTEHRVSRKQK